MTSHRLSRRRFIGMSGAGLAGAAAARWAGAAGLLADPRNADIVVLNANVYTIDPAHAASRGIRGARRQVHCRRQR